MSSFADYDLAFPTYLTDKTRKVLENELKQFTKSHTLSNSPFTPFKNSFFFQGDLLKDVPFPYWKDSQFHTFPKGNCIILSNTCDISPDNPRLTNIDCVLAPLLSVEKYEAKLKGLGYSEQRIKQFHTNLRRYELTNLFHLPIDDKFNFSLESKGYFIALDKAFSLPTQVLDINQHVYSLTQFFSYLLTFQLSVNFCRFHDKVDRDENVCFQ